MEYHRKDLTGKALTVLGVIDVDDLGPTLPHEHCIFDECTVFDEPKELKRREIFNQPLSIENLSYVRYGFDNRDCTRNFNEEMIASELKHFKNAGGRTIAEVTPIDLKRNPLALKRISIATGLNIIMGTGYYVQKSQRHYLHEDKSPIDIADEFIRDIFEGAGDTGVHAGLIGEIGCSWPLAACETKTLKGAGMAQKETGAPLHIHPGRFETAPFEIIDILKAAGADLSQTVIDHIERTVFDPQNRYKIADAGCYLEYDLWGNEGYYPESLATVDLPNDVGRIGQIKNLMDRGYTQQILISQDIDQKFRYMAFGGHGFGHIINNAVPAMLRRGITDEQIDTMLIENPKRLFGFK